MKITITKESINRHRVPNANITVIKWEAGSLDDSVLINFPNLQKLDCSNNELGSLIGIKHCPRLQILCCYNNILTSLVGIEYCTQLRVFDCSDNKLKSLEGIKHCPQLQELDCCYNQLVSLEGIEYCHQLQELSCATNQLQSLKGIERCHQLQKLYCCRNNIKSLVGIEQCRQLQELNCATNQLQSLTGIEFCSKLQDLNCSNNLLRFLSGVEYCSQLQRLNCHSNRLISLANIGRCSQLQKLNCCHNQLESLVGIEQCSQLQEFNCFKNRLKSLGGIEHCHQLCGLDCSDNRLESLESIVYLRLQWLAYHNNPIRIQTIQVQRFLDGLQRVNVKRSIYSDAQNIHDTYIQRTVCDSIQRLLTDPKPDFSIETILESNLDSHTIELLIEYCGDSCVHSIHLLTYFELLSYVWNRIVRSEHRGELFKILEEQVCDSECKCFTGRFNRTLSVLVGFYDDIRIEISDNSRIGAIILAIKNRLEPYDPQEHYAQARCQLLDEGYDESSINSWLDAIMEQDDH